MTDPPEREALEKAKRASMGQLLLKSARLLDEVALARVNRRAGAGVPLLRPAHTRLLPHIDLDGTRVGTVADRLGVTKQAVSQLVTELESLGVLELVPDPVDGRAKLVRFTRQGMARIHQGLGVLREIEEALGAELGAQTLRALENALAALTPALERLAASEALPGRRS